jgi:hypothetical protein
LHDTSSNISSSRISNSTQSSYLNQQQQQALPATAAAAAAAEGTSTIDKAARSMLSAFTALAYSCQRLKPQPKPQCYLLPPWLPAQPGKARGFVRSEGETLNPSLVLSEAEVHWLSLGCLSGVSEVRGPHSAV